jgi:hypothetical protein
MEQPNGLAKLHALAERIRSDPGWARMHAFPCLHWGRKAASAARSIATARGPEDDWIVADVSADAVRLARHAFRCALNACGLKRL